ncbi:MAG: hypothetical protein M3220_03210, partial [Chloroflexota bacterium]|nr:hypothetical protein [Chloroflexota bacterium]
MTGRYLRYELLLVATLAFEAVYLSLLSQSIGQVPGGGAVGWLPLFLAGLLMLLWNRFLLMRALWEEGHGRALSLAGALLIISVLMAATVPSAVAGPVAGPGAWLQALLGIFRFFFGELVPLTVVLFVSLFLWFRTVLIAQTPTTLPTTLSRFQWSALFIVLLLVEAASRSVWLPAATILLFFGFGLVAFALARAYDMTLTSA